MTWLFGEIEILPASCNISTVQDGRGAIFSWVPQDTIKEFTLLYFEPNKIRGNHFHPEFVEYFLVVSGSIVLITKDNKTGNNLNMIGGAGFCFRTPINIPHAVHALESSLCISLLTKPWEQCQRPIEYVHLKDFDPEYVTYMKKNNPDWVPEKNSDIASKKK
jgi:mannose-6-phosphate isomerase-like protein (cupin superfamily)